MGKSNYIHIALIPAYEPEDYFVDILKNAKSKGFQPVVVNDGSSEDKESIFKEAEKYAVVLHHPKNMGKGRALKTGLEYISKSFPSDCIVVTMDADGQHTAEDAERVCKTAEENPGSLILGSRRLSKNVPFKSLFGNTITRFIYRLSTGLNIYDTQTGLRAFKGSLISELLKISGERYEYEMNVLLECSRKNIPIKEVEIETIYIAENQSSHFNAVKDSYRIYKEIFKFSASSAASFVIDYSLYSLLSLLGLGLIFSNIAARIVSACANYTLNRRLVFKSNADIKKSSLQYFILAAFILTGNTLVLNFLTSCLGVNRYASKLFTEIIFFALSWFVQHKIIFKRKTEKERRKAECL